MDPIPQYPQPANDFEYLVAMDMSILFLEDGAWSFHPRLGQ